MERFIHILLLLYLFIKHLNQTTQKRKNHKGAYCWTHCFNHYWCNIWCDLCDFIDETYKKVNAVAEYEQEGDTYIENSNFERAQQDYAEANKLSKQLTEKKGAKGRLNQNIKENISMKQRITELLVSGYSALEERL